MPNNQVTDVGIVYQSFNGRGLITHRNTTRALVRQSNGTLWAAVRENNVSKWINIYRSDDNGFTWARMFSGNFFPEDVRKVGISGTNANGPFMALLCYEKLDRLMLIHTFYDTSLSQFNTEWFVFQMSTMVRYDARATPADTTVPGLNTVSTAGTEMVFQAPYNENAIFFTWVAATNLIVNIYKPTYQHVAAASLSPAANNFFNIFGTTVDEKGNLEIAILQFGTHFKILHYRFQHNGLTFTAPTTIYDVGGQVDIMNIDLARDGHGTLLCSWGQQSADGTDVGTFVTISTDQGQTWSAPVVIPKATGHSVYIDPSTGQRDDRSSVLGGTSGFLLTYVQRNAAGLARTFVRQITTNDNVNYVIGSEGEIGKSVAPNDPVVGARFFRPTGAKLLDLTEPGYVRVAYQIGEGNSTTQTDTQPVRFGQELLLQSAFPVLLASEAPAYVTDVNDPTSMVVNFNVIGAPNANIDYFGAGYVGPLTTRYLATFERMGNDIRMLQYEPTLTSEMNDRTAFGVPTEFAVKAFFEPLTYDDPTDVSRGLEPFNHVVERDIRKVYLSPDFHLNRTYLLNKGNYFKRTVWILNYDGNDYEVSQVVPYIVLDQIAYYSANAYVVGPTRDPFARTVLPSET